MNSPAPPTAPPRRNDRSFYTVMAAAIVLTVFIGFAPSFYLRGMFEAKPLSPLLILHGILFTSWILLFLVQVRLVAAQRTDIHRKLGVAAAMLAVVMPVVGAVAAITSAKNGFTPTNGPPPLVFLMIPLADMILFSTLTALGLYFRRRNDIHKRLMLLATLAILTPAIARVWFIKPLGIPAFLLLTDLFIVSSIVADRVRNGRFHPAFVWGGLCIIVSQPLRILFAGTPAWHAVAAWLTR